MAPDAPERSWTHPRSERALLALVEHLRQNHSVDGERMVVSGFSLGAIGTWFLAARHPELWSAAIPIAGPPVLSSVADAQSGLAAARELLDAKEIEWPDAVIEMPIMVIHSRSDELVPFGLIDRAMRSLSAAGGRVKFKKISDLGHFHTARYADYLEQAVRWLQREAWGDD